MRRILIAAAGVCGLLQPALASTVYEQLPYMVGLGSISSTRNALNGTPGYQTYDNFTLGTSTTITVVNWWGYFYYPGSSDFQIIFYTDDSGAPGSVIESQPVTPSVLPSPVSTSADFYSAALGTPVALSAGIPYWLSVFNAADASWGWETGPAVGDGPVQRRLDHTTFVSGGDKTAFQLLDAVPEPSTWLLSGTGLLWLALRRRRRPRKT